MTNLNEQINQYLAQKASDDSMLTSPDGLTHALRNANYELVIHQLKGDNGTDLCCVHKKPIPEYVKAADTFMKVGIPIPEIGNIGLNSNLHIVSNDFYVPSNFQNYSGNIILVSLARYDTEGKLTETQFSVGTPIGTPIGKYNRTGVVQEDGSLEFSFIADEIKPFLQLGLFPYITVFPTSDEVKAHFVMENNLQLHSFTIPRQAETVEEMLAQLLAEFK